ncbi:hypothetical protein HZU67_06757 [Apis mellifera carnica]|nr:hypothetical protein HZU67_06757 [Apis mellifera carnica]
MPTLEPAVLLQASSNNNEEYLETSSANDLPILSPATSGQEKASLPRGRVVGKSLEQEKGGKGSEEGVGERLEEGRGCEGAQESDQKSVKGRKARNLDVSKEKFKRKSAPARMMSVVEERRGEKKSGEEGRREAKQRKEEGKLETRSTRTKLDKLFDDSPLKIQTVPFEVKKLIGSDSKEDLLTKLALTSRIATSKRCLRQPVKFKFEQEKGKFRRDLDLERAQLDSGSVSDASTKKEKLDARRKSLRKTDKKERMIGSKDDKTLDEVESRTRDEVKPASRGRRSSSLSNDNGKSLPSSYQTCENKPDFETVVQCADKRQTRGSLLNTAEGEIQNEAVDVTSKKNSFGKRRGRIKSSNVETIDKKSVVEHVSQAKNVETDKSNSIEVIDKVNSMEQNEVNSDCKKDIASEEVKVAKGKEEGSEKVSSKSCCEKEQSNFSGNGETIKVNESLNLQLETSNSMDSGKENTLEKPAPVQKLKVGRPRKSWGAKKERVSKRSLNNVIGILTEGMNIPIETQQNALNAQTTVDNVESHESFQSNVQQSSNDTVKSQNLDKNIKSSVKNATVQEPINNFDQLIENTSPVQKVAAENLKQNPEVPETDSIKDINLVKSMESSQKVESLAKDVTGEQSPANDIILDLSRRKQKGKGSFLEKIVSKIAKQKDALLEGEVGSLLDTAADELTSILEEVGPAFSEVGIDSSTESKIKSKTENVQDNKQEIIKESTTSDNCQDILTPDKYLESKDSDVKPERERINSTEEFESDGRDVEDTNICKKEEEIVGKRIETKLQKEEQDETYSNEKVTSSNETVDESEEIRLTIAENGLDSQQVENSSREEESVNDEVSEEIKMKRKSKKKGLEKKSPKKNKRKSIESASNNTEEDIISENLTNDDVMLQSIEKSKQVPSTKENIKNDLSTEIKEARIECCTKEIVSDVTDSMDKKDDDIKIIEHFSEDNLEERVATDKEDSVTKNEDKGSHVETLDQYTKVESSTRRCSKKSHQDEKTK